MACDDDECDCHDDEHYEVRLQINNHVVEASADSEIGLAAFLSMLVTNFLTKGVEETFDDEADLDPERN